MKKSQKLEARSQKLSLRIGWLYPELMSTYGDRGNIIVLTKRCEWRGIKVKVERISLETNNQKLTTTDLLFMGGAQDTQQEIVNKDLFVNKGATLKKMNEDGVPGLFICGAYQFLGKYYKTADGKKLPGLGIFPAHTENPGENIPRLIGNILIEPSLNFARSQLPRGYSGQALEASSHLVGFENHGGRTYLDDNSMAFAKVIKGFGNNGTDKTEGILYKNSIGSYLHGPILPKNPELADWLIKTALEKKYKEKIELKLLDDSLSQKARESILNKLTN